jgi:hypothetical protein
MLERAMRCLSLVGGAALLAASACAGRIDPGEQPAPSGQCLTHDVLNVVNNTGIPVTVYELIGSVQTPLFQVDSRDEHSFRPKSNATYGARAGTSPMGQWMAHSTNKSIGDGQVRFERSCEPN